MNPSTPKAAEADLMPTQSEAPELQAVGQVTSHIVVAASGVLSVAPLGTALPVDITTALPAAWLDVGYVSPDGVEFTFGREQEEVYAWQATTPVRVLVTNEPISFGCELEQFDQRTIQLAFRGGTFTGATAPYSYTPPAAGSVDQRAACITAVDGTFTFRFCFTAVQLQDDVVFSLMRTDIIRLPLAFSVLAGTPTWKIVSDHPAFSTAG